LLFGEVENKDLIEKSRAAVKRLAKAGKIKKK
jgi:hypothetical protein